MSDRTGGRGGGGGVSVAKYIVKVESYIEVDAPNAKLAKAEAEVKLRRACEYTYSSIKPIAFEAKGKPKRQEAAE